jgi:hypothetical protein
MNIEIELTPEQFQDLDRIAQIVNLDTAHAAQLIVSLGTAYINEVAEREVPPNALSVFVHGLLQVPQLPQSIENN